LRQVTRLKTGSMTPIWRGARWTWEHNRAAGRGADTLPGGKRLFLPLRTGSGPVGVIGIDRDAPGPLLTPDERRLLDALCDQAAVAIERISLAKGLDEARVLAETERLRAALLDLDLARSADAARLDHRRRSSLRSFRRSTARPNARSCSLRLQEEAERLNRFVSNLLDMTRLESGAVELKARTDRCRRDRRLGVAAGGECPRRASRRGEHRARSADAPPRCCPV